MGHESENITLPSASEAAVDMGSVSGAPGTDRRSVNDGNASGMQDGAAVEKGGASGPRGMDRRSGEIIPNFMP